MSYPPPPSGPKPAASSGLRKDLDGILLLVAAGAGVVGYLIGFFSDTAGVLVGGMTGFSSIVAAALAGIRLLPKAPDTLYWAAPLAAYGMLAHLQDLVRGASGGIVVVLLLLQIAQAGALVALLLFEQGLVKRPGARGEPGTTRVPASATGPHPWNSGPGSGQFAQQPGGPQTGPQQTGPQSGGPQQGGPPTGPQPGGPQQGGQPPVPPPPPWNQQPGGWNPGSNPPGAPQQGQPAPFPPGQQHQGQSPQGQPAQGQQGQGQQSQGGQSGGPSGTQKMPHPGGSGF
ncbi:DUF5336 domain-containing protein [Saccharopolyspora sp. CA-218241]|uniref:DUF5336 domain-containing protein n=1 Tax=Saccharopolyspora sp. CA-218241 TaxID=3240027 RepID=UPI003D97DE23